MVSDLVQKVLTGEVNLEDQQEFMSADFFKVLEEETAFESAIHEAISQTSFCSEIDSKDWFEACSPIETAEEDLNGDRGISADQYNQLLDAVIESEKVIPRSVLHIRRNHWRALLIAASLAITAGLWSTVALFLNSPEKTGPEVITTEFNSNGNDLKTNPEPERVKEDTTWHSFHFGKKTVAFVESGKALQTKINDDSMVIVSLDSGSATFSIEKNRYRAFIVKTPYAEIRVTGTVFTVDVGRTYSLVGVREGSVTVTHFSNLLSYSIKGGESVLANRDTLISVIEQRFTEPAGMPNLRSVSLESSYRVENGQNDSILTLYRNYLFQIKSKKPDMDSAVFRFVKSNPDSRLDYLLFELSELYYENKNYKKSLQILDEFAASKNKQYAELALFRKSSILLDNLQDTLSVLNLLEQYCSLFTDGRWSETAFCLKTCISINNEDNSVDSLVNSYLEKYPNGALTDRVLFEYSEYLHNKKHDLQSAINHYSQILERFPRSKYAGTAAEKISTCIVKQSIAKRKSRAVFSHIVSN